METIRVLFNDRVAAAVLAALVVAGLGGQAQAAALVVVTPGEQNTQSAENGCAKAPCAAGKWLHYPELIGVALGAGYIVHNNGDGGAVLGCDAATAAVAGNLSFCKSASYMSSINPLPDIVIIGPFGEHDQRIVAASAANQTNLYVQSVFEGAYEGLVQKYLPHTKQIFIMTPIDVPWGGTPNLAAGRNLVKDLMLPAAKKVAQNHGLNIVDTYTAISGTPQLVTMYYGADGQLNAAGQQKMADLILAALKDASAGADAGATDAGDASADDDASDASGSGGAAGAGGVSGSTGTGGAAGAGGTPGASGTGGSSSSTGTGGASGAAGGGAPISGAQSSGGCSVPNGGTGADPRPLPIAFAAIGWALWRRSRRRTW